MPKKLTTEDFIERAKALHGEKYNYEKVVYENEKTKVTIACPIHGDFDQVAGTHLSGCGCPMCGNEIRKGSKGKLVLGVGLNDLRGVKHESFYKAWIMMLNRCYYATNKRSQSYSDCCVCKEWLVLSNFKRWYDVNYRDGYQLDKDILIKGNKMYSPNTCCYVPARINGLFVGTHRRNRTSPIGATHTEYGYQSHIFKDGRRVYLGLFQSQEDAFMAYKRAKENYVKEVATEYYNRGEITKRVYDALMRWEVEITD